MGPKYSGVPRGSFDLVTPRAGCPRNDGLDKPIGLRNIAGCIRQPSVTAIFTRPEMIDFLLPGVPRAFRCNQQIVAFRARGSVWRAIVVPDDLHDSFPLVALAPFMAQEK